MRLNNKMYCDVCCKRIDNYTEPEDCIICGIEKKERHYCKRHSKIGKKMLSIYYKEEENVYSEKLFERSFEEAIKAYNRELKEKLNKIKEKKSMSVDPNKIQVDWTKASCNIPMPQSPKEEKIKRIYEDDDFIIDLFIEDKMIRVSVFKDGHFQDEVFVRKDDYCG